MLFVPFQCCTFFDSFRSSIFGVKSTKIAFVGTIALTIDGSVYFWATLIRQNTPYPSSRPPPPNLNVEGFSCRPPPFPPLEFNVVERCGGKSRGIAFLPRESPRASDGEPAQSAVRRRNFFSTLNCKGGKGGEKRANREQKFQRWIRLRRLVHQNTICCFQH